MPRVAKESAEDTKTIERGKAELQTIVLELPVAEKLTSSFPVHVNLQLDGESANTLRKIAKAFDCQQATLRNGRRVVDVTTALRKILELISEASES